MQEIWKPVAGFEDQYEVSNLGSVRTIGRFVAARGDSKRWLPTRLMRSHVTYRGYAQLMFKVGRKNIHQLVHRLVAIAFVSGRDQGPQVNHIDGNKLNNRADNLEWCTSAENCSHARAENLYEQARGERGANAKLTNTEVLVIRSRLALGETHTAISKDYAVSRTVITRIASGARWNSVR
ncbi:NUMOD4 domain-containing protein [Delftia tsuruhatensis]|uniref:NUMOD4 domain-containing protein n=1 Tax=Delftia tsuruhatensis TaxID=180282 RepID=UPI00244C71B4|nr:NUMOD4 domain-containing protein [Delftia tsuruhatensis]MDH1824611.1 HNH endonuclease [Delftia tsuruhatensis]